MDMVPFLNNASFSGVNVLAMYRTSPRAFSRLMSDVMKYYSEGVFKLVKPLNVKKFSEIADAFRMLQSRRYVGKVVLKVESRASTILHVGKSAYNGSAKSYGFLFLKEPTSSHAATIRE